MRAKILVVDDDAAAGELIRTILDSVGLRAEALTESAKAASRLENEKFDAVFLDLHMPPPDGIELATRMRQSGHNQRTPVVMITGDEDPSMLVRAFQAGANFFLFKPIDQNRILRVVQAAQILNQRERRRSQRLEVQCQVYLEHQRRKLEGQTLDLSLTGLLVRANETFPVGSLVELELQLDRSEAAIGISARVVRTIGNDRMALEFQHLGPPESDRLQEFLLPLILARLGNDEAIPAKT